MNDLTARRGGRRQGEASRGLRGWDLSESGSIPQVADTDLPLPTIRDATTPERLLLERTARLERPHRLLHPHRDAVAVQRVMFRQHDRWLYGWLLMDLAGCVVFITGDHLRTLPPHERGSNYLSEFKAEIAAECCEGLNGHEWDCRRTR